MSNKENITPSKDELARLERALEFSNTMHLPFTIFLKSSSIFKFIGVVFHFKHFCGRFPFSIFLRSFCIFKSFEAVFHISYNLVWLHKRISLLGCLELA